MREEADAVIVVAKIKDAISDKFDVQVRDRALTLRGQRRISAAGMTGSMSFTRSVDLPSDVDSTKMTTEVKDGALHIRLPKK